MMFQRTSSALNLFALMTLLASIAPAAAQDLLWTRQTGATNWDEAWSVAVDSAGNAYITGYTEGSLGGINAGLKDVFLAKYDAAGTLLWTRQTGTAESDRAWGVAVDGAGSAYITGETRGSLGGPSAGGRDTFLAKYDEAGTLLWTRQTGTTTHDAASGVAVDGAGNAYITGETRGSLGGTNAGYLDAFLAKYDAAGVLLWTRQTGTAEVDNAYGVAVDGAGSAYIAGVTGASLGGPSAGTRDAFLAKYDAAGTPLWTRQIGTEQDDIAYGVAVDSTGNAYITGWTTGSLGGPRAGGYDSFLAKYDAAGNLLWTRQTGTAGGDNANDVAVDGAGSAYITGYTTSSLGGPNAGGWDVFLAKYDAAGLLLWTWQTGTAQNDRANGVAVDGASNAYITGTTEGSLGGPLAGSGDAFLIKYADASCYADCDKSTGNGVLDIFDFLCFQNSLVNSETYACDCDISTGNGVCDIFDFLCFQNAFVGGCP